MRTDARAVARWISVAVTLSALALLSLACGTARSGPDQGVGDDLTIDPNVERHEAEPIDLGRVTVNLAPQVSAATARLVRGASDGLSFSRLAMMWDDRDDIDELAAEGGNVATFALRVRNNSLFKLNGLTLRADLTDLSANYAIVGTEHQAIKVLDPDNGTESGTELAYLLAHDGSPFRDYTFAQTTEVADVATGLVTVPPVTNPPDNTTSSDYTTVAADGLSAQWYLRHMAPGDYAPRVSIGGVGVFSEDIGLAVMIQFPEGTSQIHLSMTLQAVLTPTADSPNLVYGGTFEPSDSLSRWLAPDATLDRTMDPQTGNHYARAYGSGVGWWGGVRYPFTALTGPSYPGEHYFFSGTFRTTGAATTNVYAYLWQLPGSSWVQYWRPTSTWQTQQLVFTPTGTQDLAVWLTNREPMAAFSAQMDNVYLVNLERLSLVNTDVTLGW